MSRSFLPRLSAKTSDAADSTDGLSIKSKRQLDSTVWGDVFTCTKSWVSEGVSLSDLGQDTSLSWLRSVQLNGLGLVIIGSSVEAVRVCIEAWHAGFKPVLVIVEDKVDELSFDGLYNMLVKLQEASFKLGVFDYGPRLLMAGSEQIELALDYEGHIESTSVQARGTIHGHSCMVEHFIGPALVVDPWLLPEDLVDIELIPEEPLPQVPAGFQPTDPDAPTSRWASAVSARQCPQPDPEAGRHGVSITTKSSAASSVRALTLRATRPGRSSKAEEADGLGRTGRYLQRAKVERALITSPSFWEERFDPERVPFVVPTYASVVPVCITGVVQTFIVMVVNKWMHSDLFPVWRTLGDSVLEVPCANAMVTLFAQSLGLTLRVDRPTVVSAVGAIMYWLVSSVPFFLKFGDLRVSDFITSCTGLIFMLNVLVVYCRYVKKMKLSRWSLAWYACVVIGTVGSWQATAINLIVYLGLLSVNGTLASIFLSFAFSAAEALLVKFVMLSYHHLIWKRRRGTKDAPGDPNIVIGDQKGSVGFCIACTHCMVETGRLVSLLAGAVRSDEIGFLANALMTVCSTVLINSAGRTFWLTCALGRVAPASGRALVCPTSVQGLHNQAKFPMGWVRFSCMFGIFLARGVIHWKWDVELLGQDPRCWCWNGMVLLTVLMAFVGELIEDKVVEFSIKHWPAPVWEIFGEVMMQRFQLQYKDDLFHLSHFFMPTTAMLHPTSREDKAGRLLIDGKEARRSASRTSRGSKNSSRSSRDSLSAALTSKSWASHFSVVGDNKDLGPDLRISPNFTAVRQFHWLQMQSLLGAGIVLTITTASLGLGSGNLFGYCRPIQEIPSLIRNILFFSEVCDA